MSEKHSLRETTPLVAKPGLIHSDSFTARAMAKFQPGSVKGSVLMMLTAVVGAGVLALPYALSQVGMVMGVTLIVVCAVISIFSIDLVIECAEASGHMSYKALGLASYGSVLSKCCELTVGANLFGNCLAYVIASTNLIVMVIKFFSDGDHVYSQRWVVMFAVMGGFVTPLALFRDISVLRFSSLVSLFTLGCLTLTATAVLLDRCATDDSSDSYAAFNDSYDAHVVHAEAYAAAHANTNATTMNDEGQDDGEGGMLRGSGSSSGDESGTAVHGVWSALVARFNAVPMVVGNVHGLLEALPLVLFAFTCQQNMFPVYKSLQRRSGRRMKKVVFRAIAMSTVLYVTLAVVVLLTFGLDTDPNFLLNDYSGRLHPLMLGVTFLMALSIVAAIAINLFSFREICFQIADLRKEQVSAKLHYSVTFSILGALLLLALNVENMSQVLGVLGATTNPAICFFFPTLFWSRLSPSMLRRSNSNKNDDEAAAAATQRRSDTTRLRVMIVVCVVVGILSLFSLMSKIYPLFASS